MNSPYKNRPPRTFWRTGVANQPTFPTDLYSKRFAIGARDHIATAGSCFAQHIARHLVGHGYNVVDAEPAPKGLSEETAQQFGYRMYSARYGNIYTARQMLQLAQEAFGLREPADIVWTRKGRFFDALRPNVEPEGLDSADEVLAHRADHLQRVRRVLETAGLFIFTLGLTEAWTHRDTGTVYPTAPGTIAGDYSPSTYAFMNFSYDEILTDLAALRELMISRNTRLRFLFTVSPVPLIATASDQHVLVATTYSKAVLRAAAGALYTRFDDVDYFPSYEIISTPFFGRDFYDSDRRSVTREGVETVMRLFFSVHSEHIAVEPTTAGDAKRVARAKLEEHEDVVCEEAFLEAFAP